MAATVMLIHGAWLTPSAWDRFRQRFEAVGMDVVVPPWPWLDRPVDALRQSPDPRLAKLGLKQITDHYATLIEAMPQPPIVIGHCFGGLIAQLLADRGLGAAIVAIDPPPPFGVRLHPLTLWNSLCVFLSLNGWNRVLHMPERAFAAAFAQTLPEAEKPYAWDKFIVPAPGRIFFQLLLGIGARVRWENPDRPPLMLIAGGKDRTVPPAMVRANYRKQLRAPSDTAFHEFPCRSHWLCNETGWEEVADRALSWARTAAVR